MCSLLQLARPYHIDGLLEAIIERLHVLLDNRNTAAVFNAAAMAAGGGGGIAFMGVNNLSNTNLNGINGSSLNTGAMDGESAMSAGLRALRINTAVPPSDDEVSSEVSEGTSASASDSGEYGSGIDDREVWNGVVSAVVGLQKRGLRGLMEGRRIREMGRGGRERRDVSDGGMNGTNGENVGLGLT